VIAQGNHTPAKRRGFLPTAANRAGGPPSARFSLSTPQLEIL
jgi:hypothetical protein